ncbi:hypothetical protein PsorP6_019309 [Peronosclerospora sorghi]|nr:hypothetical protein PsorP6_019309 [Peronosclerospora sorghi]
MTTWSTRDVVSKCLLSTCIVSCVLLGLLCIQMSTFFAWHALFPSSPRAPPVAQMHIFATKTKYWDQRAIPPYSNATNPPTRDDLVLVQSQLVARHGIRYHVYDAWFSSSRSCSFVSSPFFSFLLVSYPTAKTIRDIHTLLAKLKPFATRLPTWMQHYALPYNVSVAGALADAGKHELRDYGARLLASHGFQRPQVFSKQTFRLVHTFVPRSRQSAIAYVCTSEREGDQARKQLVSRCDLLLRFFDQCPRYQREVKTNATAQKESHTFEQSSYMTTSAQRLKQALGLTNERLLLSSTDVRSAQSACAYVVANRMAVAPSRPFCSSFDLALDNQEHHWCTLLSPSLLRAVEYLDDLEQFYWIGGGSKLNYEMAAVLLRELVRAMQARANGESRRSGIFYFAHAETTLPLLTLLGYSDRSRLVATVTDADMAARRFRTSMLAPFAANLEFRLFQHASRRDDFYAQILVNEKTGVIPGCGRAFCKLSELEELWHYYLRIYDFQAECR